MEPQVLRTSLQKYEPIILPSDDDKTLRVIEATGCLICEITQSHATDNQLLVSEVEALLRASPNAKRGKDLQLYLHLPYETLAIDQIGHSLVILHALLGRHTGGRIIIYMDQIAFDFAPIRALVTGLRNTIDSSNQIGVVLVCPFEEFNEEVMSPLFDLGVRIRVAAGWTRCLTEKKHFAINLEALRKFSEFGYRAVVQWYVHANNILSIEEQIQDVLNCNFNSGFSLPLVSQSPFYRFDADFPPLPDAIAYSELLARCYARYPHYDDVFSPLSGLAWLIQRGGWNFDLGIPSVLNILVSENGNIGVFRQSPSQAVNWANISEIRSGPTDKVRSSFIDFIRQESSAEKMPYCRGCHWRRICGGLDPSGWGSLASTALDTMCYHRKLFLEHFAGIRAPDFIFGNNFK